MANWITNKLIFKGSEEDINKVLQFIQADEPTYEGEPYGYGTIDFNKITPKPKWLLKGLSISEEQLYKYEDTERGWIDYNWGTTMNALDQIKYNNGEIIFNTAWSPVPKLIQKLAWIFGYVLLEYKWVDEYSGSVGNIKFRGKEIVEENIPAIGSKYYNYIIETF